MKKTTIYGLLSILIIGIGIGAVVGINSFNKTDKALGMTDITLQVGNTALFGTKTLNRDGTYATGTIKTTAAFIDDGTTPAPTITSNVLTSGEIGQFDIACSFTPHESATQLQWKIFGSPDNKHFYPTQIQTNTSASSTLETQVFVKQQDNNSALVASTTYKFLQPRDWSSKFIKVEMREVGVSSAFGDLFCETVKSN